MQRAAAAFAAGSPWFDLSFNCSEVDITHTPTLAKIFELFSARLGLDPEVRVCDRQTDIRLLASGKK
jgi:hypothetical protein